MPSTTIDTVVATVNDKAIRPAIVAARGIVFGIIIAVVGITVVVLFCVGFIRLTTIAGHRIWASYIVLGLIFSAVGAVLLLAAWRAHPMPERRKVVIIGSGPAGPHRRPLHGPRPARAPGHRGRALLDDATSRAAS